MVGAVSWCSPFRSGTFTIVAGLGVWSTLYRVSTKARRKHDAVAAHEISLPQHTRDAKL
jgi:hypothetical protein